MWGSSLNAKLLSGRRSCKQGMNQGLPSINPWLLHVEGRAQVPKLSFNLLTSSESKGDIISWHSYEYSLFTEQKICELLWHYFHTLTLVFLCSCCNEVFQHLCSRSCVRKGNIYYFLKLANRLLQLQPIDSPLPAQESSWEGWWGTPSAAGSAAPAAAKGAGALTGWGFNSFQRGLKGAKCGGEERKLTRNIQAEMERSVCGHCLGDGVCLASALSVLVTSSKVFFLTVNCCTTITNKAQQQVGRHREEPRGGSCDSEPCVELSGLVTKATPNELRAPRRPGPRGRPRCPGNRTARPVTGRLALTELRRPRSSRGGLPPPPLAAGHVCGFLRGGCHACRPLRDPEGTSARRASRRRPRAPHLPAAAARPPPGHPRPPPSRGRRMRAAAAEGQSGAGSDGRRGAARRARPPRASGAEEGDRAGQRLCHHHR